MKDKAKDLLEWVIRPTLHALDMHSERAETLVLATALAESGGTETRQKGGGPARGLWQMEPTTHDDLYKTYLFPTLFKRHPELPRKLRKASLYVYGGSFPPPSDLLFHNPRYACAMARIKYWRVPTALPDTLEGMAAYWKEHYNTRCGKGTVKHFLEAWENRSGSGGNSSRASRRAAAHCSRLA